MKRAICMILAITLAAVTALALCEEANPAKDVPLLVNRECPLPEGYVPEELVLLSDVIPEGLCTYEHDGMLANREAAEAWVNLLTAAHADGLTEWQFSEAYRTVEDQQRIFDETVQSYMDEYGMDWERAVQVTMDSVAPAGTSEHHTGLAFDVTVPGEYFGDTAQYVWMTRHCWEYGFILRYSEDWEDETGYEAEEWHYRYVGVEHAMKIHELDTCLELYVEMLTE